MRAFAPFLLACAAFAHAAPQFDPQRQSLPIRFDRNGIPIAATTFNGHAVEVGVDTGAGMTVLSESTARRVGVRGLRISHDPVMDALGQPIEARTGTVDLQVAGMAWRELPVLVLPDERLRASSIFLTVFEFDGLLGWNAIEGSRMTLDYRAGTLRFDPPAQPCPAANMRTVHHRPFARLEVDGVAADAFVDTGARTSVLVSNNVEGDTRRIVAGASGFSTRREGSKRVTLALGNHKWEGIVLPVVEKRDHDLHGVLLGNDLFARRQLELDGACGRFEIR